MIRASRVTKVLTTKRHLDRRQVNNGMVALFPKRRTRGTIRNVTTTTVTTKKAKLYQRLSRRVPRSLPRTMANYRGTIRNINNMTNKVRFPRNITRPAINLYSTFQAYLKSFIARAMRGSAKVIMVLNRRLLGNKLPILLGMRDVIMKVFPRVPCITRFIRCRRAMPITNVRRHPPYQIVKKTSNIRTHFL